MSLERQIKKFKNAEKKLLFTTPSHAQGNFIPEKSKNMLGEKVFECDFSEIEGFDNLRKPEGILNDLLAEFSEIYSSKRTFILTNGSSSGLIAAMLAVLKDNDKVIVARNCHVSVTNGLVLTGAVPVWILPEFDPQWGIFKGITADSVKNALNSHPDAKAVILTSPTYEGLFSELEEISKLTKNAQIPLIVDEAHGALLPFGDFCSKPAIHCGADVSVQSLHKTAGALTPAALLHVGYESLISAESIQNALNLINTTSPSYPLMLSVEQTVKFLASSEGFEAVSALQNEIKRLSGLLPAGYEVYSGFNDPTKILFRINGKNAYEIAEILNNKCAIEEEFTNGKSLLFITGIGTDNFRLRKLFEVLSEIRGVSSVQENEFSFDFSLPKCAIRPRDAFFAQKSLIPAKNAIGKVAAQALLHYPPGIPVLVPGELVNPLASKLFDEIECVL